MISTLKLPSTCTLGGSVLQATPFMYDSSHFADVQWYLEVVFGWHAFLNAQRGAGGFRLRTGDFTEDKLGNAIMSSIRSAPDPVLEHALYGLYVLDNGETVYVQ
jgi:hypothetical protein